MAESSSQALGIGITSLPTAPMDDFTTSMESFTALVLLIRRLVAAQSAEARSQFSCLLYMVSRNLHNVYSSPRTQTPRKPCSGGSTEHPRPLIKEAEQVQSPVQLQKMATDGIYTEFERFQGGLPEPDCQVSTQADSHPAAIYIPDANDAPPQERTFDSCSLPSMTEQEANVEQKSCPPLRTSKRLQEAGNPIMPVKRVGRPSEDLLAFMKPANNPQRNLKEGSQSDSDESDDEMPNILAPGSRTANTPQTSVSDATKSHRGNHHEIYISGQETANAPPPGPQYDDTVTRVDGTEVSLATLTVLGRSSNMRQRATPKGTLKVARMALSTTEVDKDGLMKDMVRVFRRCSKTTPADAKVKATRLLSFVMCDLLGEKAVKRVAKLISYCRTTSNGNPETWAPSCADTVDAIVREGPEAYATLLYAMWDDIQKTSPKNPQVANLAKCDRMIGLRNMWAAVDLLLKQEDINFIEYLKKQKANGHTDDGTQHSRKRSGQHAAGLLRDVMCEQLNLTIPAYYTARQDANITGALIDRYTMGIITIFHPFTKVRLIPEEILQSVLDTLDKYIPDLRIYCAEINTLVVVPVKGQQPLPDHVQNLSNPALLMDFCKQDPTCTPIIEPAQEGIDLIARARIHEARAKKQFDIKSNAKVILSRGTDPSASTENRLLFGKSARQSSENRTRRADSSSREISSILNGSQAPHQTSRKDMTGTAQRLPGKASGRTNNAIAKAEGIRGPKADVSQTQRTSKKRSTDGDSQLYNPEGSLHGGALQSSSDPTSHVHGSKRFRSSVDASPTSVMVNNSHWLESSLKAEGDKQGPFSQPQDAGLGLSVASFSSQDTHTVDRRQDVKAGDARVPMLPPQIVSSPLQESPGMVAEPSSLPHCTSIRVASPETGAETGLPRTPTTLSTREAQDATLQQTPTSAQPSAQIISSQLQESPGMLAEPSSPPPCTSIRVASQETGAETGLPRTPTTLSTREAQDATLQQTPTSAQPRAMPQIDSSPSSSPSESLPSVRSSSFQHRNTPDSLANPPSSLSDDLTKAQPKSILHPNSSPSSSLSDDLTKAQPKSILHPNSSPSSCPPSTPRGTSPYLCQQTRIGEQSTTIQQIHLSPSSCPQGTPKGSQYVQQPLFLQNAESTAESPGVQFQPAQAQ